MSTTLPDVRQQFDRDINTEDTDNMNQNAPPVVRIILSIATGMLFGIALEKGRVFEPQVIRNQMLLKSFGMMKMFLSASAIGILWFAFLFGMPQTMRRMTLALQNYAGKPPFKSLLGVITGAALLGCGMTVAGACPGTSLVQLGTGVENAWISVTGGLLGAVVYSMIKADLPAVFMSNTQPKYVYVHRYLEVPYASVAIPISCVLAAVVFGLEFVYPWHEEIDPALTTEGLMKAGAWPPFIAGMLIGSLQIPTILANEDTLGSSSSYVTLLSALWPFNINNQEAYLKNYRYGLHNWWQVLHVVSAVFGGAISATASQSIGTVAGVSWHHALSGGFLMVFGARLAGGCTSGHGLSGFGLLALASFAAVPAMFTGGITTAFFMKYVLGVEM